MQEMQLHLQIAETKIDVAWLLETWLMAKDTTTLMVIPTISRVLAVVKVHWLTLRFYSVLESQLLQIAFLYTYVYLLMRAKIRYMIALELQLQLLIMNYYIDDVFVRQILSYHDLNNVEVCKPGRILLLIVSVNVVIFVIYDFDQKKICICRLSTVK